MFFPNSRNVKNGTGLDCEQRYKPKVFKHGLHLGHARWVTMGRQVHICQNK